MRTRTLGIAIGVALLVVGAHAQTIGNFTLTHGTATYSEGNLIGANNRADGGLAVFKTLAGGPNNMFQNWWWYHTDTSAREASLGQQVFGTASGNSARIVYLQNGGPTTPQSLQFDIEYTLTEVATATALVQIVWKVHNLANVAQDLSFFAYSDFDLDGTFGDDSGAFQSPNQFNITDGSSAYATLTASGTGLAGWEQGSFSGIRDRLTNAVQDNLVNAPANFGPGDWTGAFQWNFNLAANGAPGGADQQVGTLLKLVHNPVPEPASMFALAIGAASLVARRRRRA